jgi:hypothetical protein
MNPTRLKNQIEEGASEIRRLHARIHETVKERDQSPEKRSAWELACKEFHNRYDQLSFPGGSVGAYERILAGDPSTIESALCFIEVRPYFFRSGYLFKDLLRKLKRAPLDEPSMKRLSAVVAAYEFYRQQSRANRA